MPHTFWPAREDLRVERCGRVLFAALARHFPVLVFVLGVARRATRLLDIGPNHGDDGMVGNPAFARTVIVQNVTKPRLALLHQTLPNEPLAGDEI